MVLRAGDRLGPQLADGSTPAERLPTGSVAAGEWQGPQSFSPDGRSLLFNATNRRTGLFDLWLLPLAGNGKPRNVILGWFDELARRVSPGAH